VEPITAVGQVSSILKGVRSIVDTWRGLRQATRTGARPRAVAQASTVAAGTAAKSSGSIMDRLIVEFIEQHDADGNGSLSAAEFGGAKEVFSILDADGDGSLTGAELRQACPAHVPKGGS